MRGEGIRVELVEEGDGGWALHSEGLDEAAFDQIDALCQERAGPFPKPAPITRAEYSALYDLNLAAKRCLEAQGVAVSDPPSREKYVEDSLNSTDGPWSPFDDDRTAFDHIETCPQPDIYDVYGVDLYGRDG